MESSSLNHPSNIAPQHMFDGVSLAEHAFQAPGIPPHHRQPSPGSSSSNNDRHLEPPQTYEALLRENTVLKTRVSELEVVNELYRGHVSQYPQGQAAAPPAEMIPRDTESELRATLGDVQRREDDLKRQVEELQSRLAEHEGDEPPAKRAKKANDPGYPEPPQAAFDTNGLHA